MRVELEGRHLAQIRLHVEAVYPEEGCGVLVGRDWGDRRTVERVHALRNVRRRSRTRGYRIEPEDFLAVEKRARETGLEVIGFFHSHPDHPAQPSATDRASAWPYYLYLIAAVRQGRMEEVEGFTFDPASRRFAPAELETVGRKPSSLSAAAGARA